MREVVEYLAKSLADHPEAVKVSERRGRGKVVYVIEADPEDRGRIIGKKGRVIESIRTLVRAFARRRVNVEVR